MTKKNDLIFSFIIPVYNRPAEIKELLESLSAQTVKNFEVIIVEDGSTLTCKKEVDDYNQKLNLSYFYKDNSGPGLSRNYGYEKAKGNYCIFLDSDCILPPSYFEIVQTELKNNYVDAFGGPDKAHHSFTRFQKAVNYSMTSFFTTGGIRGGGEKLDKFYPRSFNMGFSRKVFEETGGFPGSQFAKSKAAGEDMDLSITIKEKGFKTALIKKAYVYHKRRTGRKQFFNQVFNFGYARIILYKRHPKSLKWLHFAPAAFIAAAVLLIFLSFTVSAFFITPLLLHLLLIFLDSTVKNKSAGIGFLSILTSYIQLIGYGSGFINAGWKQLILRKTNF